MSERDEDLDQREVVKDRRLMRDLQLVLAVGREELLVGELLVLFGGRLQELLLENWEK